METILLVLVGCFAGVCVCSKIGVFIAVLLKERRAALAAGSAWPVYSIIALHSGPWLLLISIALLILFARAESPPAWSFSLVGGFCFAPVVYGLALWRINKYLRARRLERQA